jgi:hypothetical protein
MWPDQSAVVLRFFRADSFCCVTVTDTFTLRAVAAVSLAVTMTAVEDKGVARVADCDDPQLTTVIIKVTTNTPLRCPPCLLVTRLPIRSSGSRLGRLLRSDTAAAPALAGARSTEVTSCGEVPTGSPALFRGEAFVRQPCQLWEPEYQLCLRD